MSDFREKNDIADHDGVVAFSGHLLQSPAFLDLFDRGMTLVEEAATYLDTTGRTQSKLLEREASLAYATESMRLTTRLMQLASWLLLQRAVSEGEMTIEQAREERQKVKLKAQDVMSQAKNWTHLPGELQLLIERSQRLQEQIMHFDEALDEKKTDTSAGDNPLAGQMQRLKDAFERP
ncbi:MAG: DUF1465 family protein [Pseudomonadota bacterium]